MTEHPIESQDNAHRPTRRVFLSAAAAVGMLAPAVPALAARAAAQGGTRAERGAGTAPAVALPPSPSRTISAFTGPNATGTQVYFWTSDYHSKWISFKSVVGFNPSSIINNSGSGIWVYDEENADAGSTIAGPYFAFGTSLISYTFTDWMPINSGTSSQSYTSQAYQPSWFFIQYGVNTGATQPPTPPA